MKWTYLFLTFFFPPIFTFAQLTEGEIIYQTTIKLDLEIPEEDKAMFGNLPTSQTFTRHLLFNEEASMYKTYEGADDGEMDFSAAGDRGDIQIKMKVPENAWYTNFMEGTAINKREFFGRMFLISGDAEKLPWKMTGEQKKVLEYVCQKAVMEDEERKVEAWFSPQIPVSGGPSEFSGLPGMVLELNVDDGSQIVQAVQVNAKEINGEDLKKPKKGKAISREDFDKMEAEKMKEMEEEMGGSGGRIIIRN